MSKVLFLEDTVGSLRKAVQVVVIQTADMNGLEGRKEKLREDCARASTVTGCMAESAQSSDDEAARS